MSVFNTSFLRTCSAKPDPETGCSLCGGGDYYEECRQAFYLKQQNEILSHQASQNAVGKTNQGVASSPSESNLQTLQQENANLKQQADLLRQQNQALIGQRNSSMPNNSSVAGYSIAGSVSLVAALVLAIVVLIIKHLGRL